jgi:hypothetical protein
VDVDVVLAACHRQRQPLHQGRAEYSDAPRALGALLPGAGLGRDVMHLSNGVGFTDWEPNDHGAVQVSAEGPKRRVL